MSKDKDIKMATAESMLASGSAFETVPYDIEGIGRVNIKKIGNIEFKQWLAASKEEDDLYSDGSFIQLCIVDSSGQPLFKCEQIPRIVTMKQYIIGPLINKCLDNNGIGKKAEKDIAKNLKTPTSDS